MAAYEKIETITLSSSASQVDFTGLSIDAGELLYITADVDYTSGTTNGQLNLYINNNTTLTNYYRRTFIASTSVTGGLSNNSTLTSLSAGIKKKVEGFIHLSKDIPCALTKDNFYNTFAGHYQRNICTTFTASSITQITLDSSADNMDAGSTFTLYKVIAEDVADITVSSNTNQIDITGLSIASDNEYILVSDIVNNATSTVDYELFLNTDTTSTNYYTQDLRSSGIIGASGSKSNDAIFARMTSDDRLCTMSNIKLLSDGYPVVMNNTIRNIDDPSVLEITKAYINKTATLSSITQISIKSSQANGIGTGSRFKLYLMK